MLCDWDVLDVTASRVFAAVETILVRAALSAGMLGTGS
jgi:hypothetical protein